MSALPEKDPQFIIDTAIRKVVLFDNKIEIHYNFIAPAAPSDPDGSSPEDRRDNSLSAKSSFLCIVPPQAKKTELFGSVFSCPWRRRVKCTPVRTAPARVISKPLT